MNNIYYSLSPPEEIRLCVNMIFKTFVCLCVETKENFYFMQHFFRSK